MSSFVCSQICKTKLCQHHSPMPHSLCVRQSTGRATRATASSARHVIIAAAAGTATNRTASSADDVSLASNVSEVLLTTCTSLTYRWPEPPDHRRLRRHISLSVADHLDESGCTENYHCELNAFCISNHCSCVSGFRPTPGGHCVKYHGALLTLLEVIFVLPKATFCVLVC